MSFNPYSAVRAALLNNAPLMTLLGDDPTRITTDFAFQGQTKPYIVITKVTGQQEGAHDGDQALTHNRYQFNIGGTDKDACDAIALLLIKFNCTEYNYVDGAETTNLTFFHEDDRSGWNSGDRHYLPSVDLIIWFNR